MLKNMLKKLIFLPFLSLYLYAIPCGEFSGEFQEYDGHYYAITGEKMTYESARNFAQANGGYLAIPNSSGENNFIKSIIRANNEAWIGIYDPNYSQDLCFSNNCFSTNRGRFKTVLSQDLSFQNWDSSDIENRFIQGDDAVDIYGLPIIATLGEHYTLMSGTSGLWRDWGTHANSGEIPYKQKAVLEFDTMPECFEPPSTVTDEITGRVCNSQVWDEIVGVQEGNTFECQTDTYGNEYCPEALAPAGEYWDYDDGFSVAEIGQVVDFALKEKQFKCPSNNYLLANKYFDSCGHCIDRTYYEVRCSTNGTVTVLHESRLKGNNAYNGGRVIQTYNQSNIGSNVGQTYLGNIGQGCNYLIYYSRTCDGVNCTYKFNINSNCNGSSYSTNTVAPIPYIFSCPSGYTETTGTETSQGECKRTISYTYYNYLCSTDQNAQGESYTPTISTTHQPITDPNTSTINSSTLDDTQGSSTPPSDNCKRQGFTCNSNLRTPAWVDGQWQCSPFPCVGESNFENFGTVEGENDANNEGWTDDGSCAGDIYIFNGKDYRCRDSDVFFGLTGGGCCDKEKVFMGLVACKENEKMLAEKNKSDFCKHIGNYCSKKINLGFDKVCVQTSQSHCCFNSKLARIIMEEGRIQLKKGWGSAEAPDCRGFKPEEFQKLDMSKMDLAEAFEDIQVDPAHINTLSTHIQSRVGNIQQ